MTPESSDSVSASEPEILKIGRYHVLDYLGRGGMGLVVKARNPDIDKLVAIKVLNSSLLIDSTSLERFKIEARAGSRLSHPNLVSIFDFGVTDDGNPYMVMEYIQGKSLEDILRSEGIIPIDVFLEIFEQVVKALQYIHKNGVVHRDIKTSNIMLQNIEGDLYAKLVDFGIAKVLADGENNPQKLTKTGSVFGSPPYMSPEQCRGLTVDARSDIYSLGCVMYECIRGVPPIVGDNALQTIFMHVSSAPAPLEELESSDNAKRATARLILKCLEKDPGKRFASCTDLLTELSTIKKQYESKQFHHEHESSSPQPTRLANPWKAHVAAAAKAPLPPDDSKSSLPKNGSSGPVAAAEASDPQHKSISTSGKFDITADNDLHSTDPNRLRHGVRDRMSADRGTPGRAPALAGKIAVPLLAVVLIALAICGGKYGGAMFKDMQQGNALKAANETFARGRSHWDEAKTQFQSALSGITEKKDPAAAAQIHNSLALIALNENKPDEALSDLDASLKLMANHQSSTEYASALIHKGEAETMKSNLTEAKTTLAQARKVVEKSNQQPDTQGDLALAEARLLAKSDKKPDAALAKYDLALQEYERSSNSNPESKTAAWLESARLYNALQVKDQAKQRAEMVVKTASAISDDADRQEVIREANELIQLNSTSTAQAAAPAAPPALTNQLSIVGNPVQPTVPPITQMPQMPQMSQMPQMPQFPQMSQLQQAQQVTPIPSSSALPQAALDLMKARGEADLKLQQLEQIRRAQEYNKQLQKMTDEAYKNVSENMARQNNAFRNMNH
jgi:serine/threonine-protein kinase